MRHAVHLVPAFGLVALMLLAGCADEESPRILWVSFPPSTSDQVGPYEVEAVVEDNCCLRWVELLIADDPDDEPDRLRMEPLGEGHHGASFGGLPTGTLRLLAIEALDEHGNRARYPVPDSQPETDCELVPDGTCWVRFEVLE